jgi:hypothetical protein
MAAALPAVGVASLDALPGVFKGRELTRKDRRLSASLAPIDILLEGGIPRGRISEIVGRRSCGKTSIAAGFIRSATRRGEVAAVIDLANAFDPSTMAEAGVDLSRVLWVQPGQTSFSAKSSWRKSHPCIDSFSKQGEPILSPLPDQREGEGEGTPQVTHQISRRASMPRRSLDRVSRSFLRAAEMVLEAGGFGLLVMDFGECAFSLSQSSALRLARMAERSATAVLMLVTRPVCGTFAALSVDLAATRALFSYQRNHVRSGLEANLMQYLKCIRHPHPRPLPRQIVGEGTEKALFEGLEISATLRRNKIGCCGTTARWRALVNPADFTVDHQRANSAGLV